MCTLRLSKYLWIVAAGLLINAMPAFATGGYLTFASPAGTPALLDELDFTFRMGNNPGPDANVYFSHNFNFISSRQEWPGLSGYIGLQSTAILGAGTQTYALVTVWPQVGQVVNLQPGPAATCNEQNASAEGHVATCVITSANVLATAPMKNGDTFRIYIRNVDAPAPNPVLTSPFSTGPAHGPIMRPVAPLRGGVHMYQFGIQNLRSGAVTVLGTMSIIGISGLSSAGVSHFLEYFGGNAGDCRAIPYTAYTEEGPVGWSAGKKYRYSVFPNPQAPTFGPCQSNVTFATDNLRGSVEFAIDTPYRP